MIGKMRVSQTRRRATQRGLFLSGSASSLSEELGSLALFMEQNRRGTEGEGERLQRKKTLAQGKGNRLSKAGGVLMRGRPLHLSLEVYPTGHS